MACRIETHCNACGICLAICPVNAIVETAAGIEISRYLCTECVGYAEAPVCIPACPIDAISEAATMGWEAGLEMNRRDAGEIY